MADNEPINLDTYRSGQSLGSMINRLKRVVELNERMRREYPELAAGCEERIIAAETAIGRLSLLAGLLEGERRGEDRG
jgi:hypothetical protein